MQEAKQDTDFWGRLVESAIGASLMNSLKGQNIELFYWSSRNRGVDFVLSRGKHLVALEVKSGRRKTTLPGIEAFSNEFPVTRKLLIGSQGVPVEDFLHTPQTTWL